MVARFSYKIARLRKNLQRVYCVKNIMKAASFCATVDLGMLEVDVIQLQ